MIHHSFAYLLLALLIISCYSSSRPSKQICQIVSLSKNNSSDTNKVVLEGMAWYDTIASEVHGTIVDNITFLPIVHAVVTLKKDERQLLDTTNAKGLFLIAKNGFEGLWTITVKQPFYKCLTIDSVKVESGEGIKLKIKLTKRI